MSRVTFKVRQQNILVFCFPGIGDALMSSPMISYLKKSRPCSQITVVTMIRAVESVFENDSNVDEVVHVPLYRGSFYRSIIELYRLRKKRFDISILPIPAYRREYQIFSFLVGARRRISHSFQTGQFRELHFLQTTRVMWDEKLHNVENNIRLLEPLGIDVHSKPSELEYDFNLSLVSKNEGSAFFSELGWKPDNVIAFLPGSNRSPFALMKRWPIENWLTLAHQINHRSGHSILVILGPEENDLAGTFQAQNKCNWLRVVEPNSISLCCGIINLVHSVVGNDNGIAHLAVAMQKPTLTLFAPTNPDWTRPWGRTSHVIQAPEFEPWHRYELKRGVPAGVVSGMDKITVDFVLTFMKSLNEKFTSAVPLDPIKS